MSKSLRDQILAISDLPTEEVIVPQWGGMKVWVRGLTAYERDAFEADNITGRGKNRDVNLRGIRARLVALCAVDENGERIFSNDDVEALGGKSSAAVGRLFDVASRLNGISESDVEELAGN